MKANKEIIKGLSLANMENIANQILERNDSNHPLSTHKKNKRVLDTLKNAKPNISASSVFIKKVSS